MRSRAGLVIVFALLTWGVGSPSSGGSLSAQLPGELWEKVDPSLDASVGPVESFVHARPGALDEVVEAVASAGAPVLRVHEQVSAVYTMLSLTEVRALATKAAVAYIEADKPLRYLTETSHAATRSADVYRIPVIDSEGQVVDGSGVGVAVIDSGADGTHPDLAPRIVRNYKVLCNCPTLGGVIELDNTDEGGGHGTHVSGTVAGTGGASGGRFAGAARGAGLYVLGAGAGLSIVNATGALQWVLDNHDQVDPPIRVLNNSWGGDAGHSDPNSMITRLTDQLIAEGVVVVWAAGNGGGDGSAIATNAYANNLTLGNISVANYSDLERGTRNGSLSSSSSRGASDEPDTWPDVSAPGTSIMATCRLTLPVCNANLQPNRQYPNLYAGLSGTSMAAPHVAGIVAQVLQAAPELTPAQVEDVLEDTAFRFTFSGGGPYVADPHNPTTPSSFDKGHGLVDVMRVLQVVCVDCGGL